MGNNCLNIMHLLKNDYDTENKLLLKEKERYDKIIAEMNNEINTLNNKIKYDKLMHYFKSEDTIPIRFNDFNNLLVPKRKITDGSIDLQEAKESLKKI